MKLEELSKVFAALEHVYFTEYISVRAERGSASWTSQKCPRSNE